MVSTTTATMPPLDLLLGLETETLMGVVDAWAAGGMWEALDGMWEALDDDGDPRWVLFEDGDGPALFVRYDRDGSVWARGLPNPLGEGDAADAAAYRMETRERLAVHPNGPVWGACDRSVPHHWRWHRDRKTAACLAVCHKYAEHPGLGPLCREVIRRLTPAPPEAAAEEEATP